MANRRCYGYGGCWRGRNGGRRELRKLPSVGSEGIEFCILDLRQLARPSKHFRTIDDSVFFLAKLFCIDDSRNFVSSAREGLNLVGDILLHPISKCNCTSFLHFTTSESLTKNICIDILGCCSPDCCCSLFNHLRCFQFHIPLFLSLK